MVGRVAFVKFSGEVEEAGEGEEVDGEVDEVEEEGGSTTNPSTSIL